MWDENDSLARWIHGLCAIPVIAFIVFDSSLLFDFGDSYAGRTAWESSALVGSVYLACRLLWYAVTGKNCINRDEFE